MHTKSFFQQVYELVRQVPPGSVTTYREIAHMMGTKDARRIGHALHANKQGDVVPCHRVVFTSGKLAPGYAFGGEKEQLRRLQLEGVHFLDEHTVDLSKSLFTFVS